MRNAAHAALRHKRLPAYSIDGLDPCPSPPRTLGDLAILRLNEMARRRVPVQAAQHGAGYLAVGRDCSVLVDDVEQHELAPRGRLSAPHPLIPLCCVLQWYHAFAQTGTRRESSLSLATRSNGSPLLLIR